LNIGLDRVGNRRPSDWKRVSLEPADGLSKRGDRDELFAIAQYQDFSDAQKLSKPAFQPENAGLELAASDKTFASGRAVKRYMRCEQVVIDTAQRAAAAEFRDYAGCLFNHFLKGGAVTKSTLSNHYQTQLQPFKDKVRLQPDNYVVAFTSNNTAYNEQAAFHSEAQAREFMSGLVADNAALQDDVHVIPSFERRDAA
jgi:hypothetical protein